MEIAPSRLLSFAEDKRFVPDAVELKRGRVKPFPRPGAVLPEAHFIAYDHAPSGL